MDDKARIQSIFQTGTDMVISTADKDGNPWITPVSYAFDQQYCLYWVSAKDSRHSSNIRERKEVSIVIYMYEPKADAVYIEAEAEELTDDAEIIDAIKVRSSRPQLKKFEVKSLEEVTSRAAWRIYKAIPKAMYVRESTMVENQAVTIRRKIA